ncbi:SRG-32 protein, partial [Aphelenchoides avenae]
DWLSWIFLYITMRAYGAPIFFDVYASLPRSGAFPTTAFFCMHYFMLIQYATSFVVGLNRFSAVAVPRHYKRFWRRHLRLVVFLILAFPVPFSYHIIQYGATMTLYPAGPGYAAFFMFGVNATEAIANRDSLFTTVWSAVDLVALVVFNASIAVVLYRRRQMLVSRDSLTADSRDTELKLYALTCVISVFLAVSFCTQLVYFAYSGQMSILSQGILIMIATFATDLHTCSTPWFLLLMSRAVREEILDAFPWLRSLKFKRSTPSTSGNTITE